MIAHQGLRHLALRVRDVERAKEFYMRVFGLKLVWQPDPAAAYLSSGVDNLALHRGDPGDPARQALDHLGFVVATIAGVEAAYTWAQNNGIDIARPLAHHRDGAVSFYLRDPDGNVIQVLYEPAISPVTYVAKKE